MSEPRVKMQVRHDWPEGGKVAVFWDGRPAFELAPGEMKAIFVPADRTAFEVEGAFGRLAHAVRSAGDERVLVALRPPARSLWSRLIGGASPRIEEVERAAIAPYAPPPTRALTLQIWAGRAESSAAFHAFVGERDDYWDRSEEDEDYPLSDFIETQGRAWFDHDFTEALVAEGDMLDTAPSAERFRGSWADQWGPWLDARMAERGDDPPDAVWFMTADRAPDGTQRLQIAAPRDAVGRGVVLAYLGECTVDA